MLATGGLCLMPTNRSVAVELAPHLPTWKPYGIVGNVAYAPVRLDGRPLFVIAAERQGDDNKPWGLEALQVRRNLIENRLRAQLQGLIENKTDPDALQVVTTQLNQQMAVQVIADGEANRPIVTVTTLDAEVYGLSEAEVAQEYAQQIQQGLSQALLERQPQAMRSHLWRGNRPPIDGSAGEGRKGPPPPSPAGTPRLAASSASGTDASANPGD